MSRENETKKESQSEWDVYPIGGSCRVQPSYRRKTSGENRINGGGPCEGGAYTEKGRNWGTGEPGREGKGSPPQRWGRSIGRAQGGEGSHGWGLSNSKLRIDSGEVERKDPNRADNLQVGMQRKVVEGIREGGQMGKKARGGRVRNSQI